MYKAECLLMHDVVMGEEVTISTTHVCNYKKHL